MPGASPETMATSVATPLERHLGIIADVTEMTSSSQVGTARRHSQFELSRTSTARRAKCRRPSTRRASTCRPRCSNPTLSQGKPVGRAGDHPRAYFGDDVARQIYDTVSNIVSQRLAQVDGVGDVEIGGCTLPAVRIELLPLRSTNTASAAKTCALLRSRRATPTGRRGRSRATARACSLPQTPAPARRRLRADGRRLAQRRGSAARGRRRGHRRRREHTHPRPSTGKPAVIAHHASRGPTSSRPWTA